MLLLFINFMEEKESSELWSEGEKAKKNAPFLMRLLGSGKAFS